MIKFKVLGTVLLFSLCLAFRPSSNSDQIVEKIREDYLSQLAVFEQSLKSLTTEAEAYQKGEIPIDRLQSVLTGARIAFKKIEPFAAYFQEQAIVRFVNGAPLPKVDESAPEHTVIPPLGLQTLDEAIFSEEPDPNEILHLSQTLIGHWPNIADVEKSRNMEHRYIFEAFRYQLIRLFTLGLTGFDTPGSVNAIPEAISSLEAMERAFSYYEALSPDSTPILVETLGTFTQYLKEHPDFDSLDRLHILREFINPIYQHIYTLQEALNIEFVEEVDRTLKAVNYHTPFLFDASFLNKSYYAQVAESDLNDPRKIELGRKLFFDPILSSNVKMSCATCHQPYKAFTDGLAKSRSNTPGETTLRNAPTLINAVYADKYFYDLREYDLERQVKHVVYDKKEFNMDFVDLADRLKESEEYLKLFKESYGERDKYGISSWSISNSLAAYVASLSSWNSPFDQYARGETDEISAAVKRGFNLFMGKAACGTCHFAPSFGGTVPPNFKESESEILGVPATPDSVNAYIDPDPGRFQNGRIVDQLDHFLFSFKTPGIRNIALTAPYMHNGVYQTLEEVMDFYNKGGGIGLGFEVPNQTLPFDSLSLNSGEIQDVISFMESLTDTVGLTAMPSHLPQFPSSMGVNKRKIGGSY